MAFKNYLRLLSIVFLFNVIVNVYAFLSEPYQEQASFVTWEFAICSPSCVSQHQPAVAFFGSHKSALLSSTTTFKKGPFALPTVTAYALTRFVVTHFKSADFHLKFDSILICFLSRGPPKETTL